MRKTHHTALVVVPPRRIWPPIQALRERYDRQVRRWMPHINVLYPFVAPEDFPRAMPLIRGVTAAFPPFRLQLARFAWFRHSPGHYTLWLAPEPDAPLRALHRALVQVFPQCDDLDRFPQGYTPHLSVGQFRGDPNALQRFVNRLQRRWQPLRFEVDSLALIRRGDPPRDVFREVCRFSLGRTVAP